MNAVARAAFAENTLVRSIQFNFELSELKIGALVFFMLITALGLVYVKDLNRRLFITNHKLQIKVEQLQADNNKLLLEQSAWSAQARVQMVAQRDLAMQIPPSTDVVMIKV